MRDDTEETSMIATATIDGAESKNMRLIGHSDLGGFGNGGEGMGLQKTKDGRRIMYIAHECAPINFSVVDVTDPSKPHLVTQTKLPHAQVRSNSLDLVGEDRKSTRLNSSHLVIS